MANSQINARIIHKHDIETNWKLATNFIPKQGEIIIYDKDSTYNYERFKIGDGTTLVSALPFANDALKSEIQTLLNGKASTSSVTQLSNRVDGKVDKDGSKVLSTNDYTTAEKNKLAGIASGANNYSLPTASSSTKGGVITGAAITDTTGYTAVHIKDGVIYYKDTNTNTHYTTRLYAGASGTVANAAATNPYLKVTDDNTYRNQIQFKGDGATTVSSDANGVITISSTDTNTHAVTSVFGRTGAVTLTKSDVTTALGYTPPTTDTNTDTKVTQTVTTTDASYPILLAPSGQTATTTTTSYFDSGVTLNPSTNTIEANISGNAATASSVAWSNIKNKPSTFAPSSHTHNYAGSSSAGGAATSANKVNSSLSIQLNSGTATVFDGSEAKTINITASSIGAAAASHGTHIPLNCTTITDWNNATTNGWYMGSNISNQPVSSGGWFYGLTIVHNTNYVRQIAWHFASDNSVDGTNCDRFERVKHNGTWGSWINTSVRVAVPSNAKFTDTDTTYSAGNGLSLSGTTFSVKTGYTNSGKNYKVQADSSGNLYVNVPWTDTTYTFTNKAPTLSWGTTSTIGTVGGTNLTVTMPSNPNTSHTHTSGIGLTQVGTGGISGTTTFLLNLNSETSLGTIGTTSKLYAVGVDANGKLCVNVPWTDNNTTYSAGTGLSLTGTKFSVSKVPIEKGGTGSTSKSGARTNLGISSGTSLNDAPSNPSAGDIFFLY